MDMIGLQFFNHVQMLKRMLHTNPFWKGTDAAHEEMGRIHTKSSRMLLYENGHSSILLDKLHHLPTVLLTRISAAPYMLRRMACACDGKMPETRNSLTLFRPPGTQLFDKYCRTA